MRNRPGAGRTRASRLTGALGNQQGLYLIALSEAAPHERTGDELRIRDTLGESTLLFAASDPHKKA